MHITTSATSPSYYFYPLLTEFKVFNSEVQLTPVLDQQDLIWTRDEDGNLATKDIPSTFRSFQTYDYSIPDHLLLGVEYPTLATFFSQNFLDVPTAFKGLRSLNWEEGYHPHSRLISILSRHGRRYYVAKLYSNTLWKMGRRYANQPDQPFIESDWLYIYSLFSNYNVVGLAQPGLSLWPDDVRMPMFGKYLQDQKTTTRTIFDIKWLHDKLFQEILRYTPLFSFVVRQVDKRKFKHSRGKSGKHTVYWRYIPLYKRILTVIQWFSKDIRMQKGKTLRRRLELSMEVFFFARQSHLVTRLRSFVHLFAFQNHKKSLLRTLRQTS